MRIKRFPVQTPQDVRPGLGTQPCYHTPCYHHVWNFRAPDFPIFRPNTDQKNSEYGHFSRSDDWITRVHFTLHKKSNFFLISSCEKFVERRCSASVSGESPKTLLKLCLFTKFLYYKIWWNYGILCHFTKLPVQIP